MSIAPLTPAEQDAALRARLAVSERALKALARRAATLAAPLPAAGDEQAPAEEAEERRALQRTRLAIDTQQFLGTLARASRVAESTAAQEMAAYEAELLAIGACPLSRLFAAAALTRASLSCRGGRAGQRGADRGAQAGAAGGKEGPREQARVRCGGERDGQHGRARRDACVSGEVHGRSCALSVHHLLRRSQ